MLTGVAWGLLFSEPNRSVRVILLRRHKREKKKSKEGVQVSQKFYRKARSEGLTGCWKQLMQLAGIWGRGWGTVASQSLRLPQSFLACSRDLQGTQLQACFLTHPEAGCRGISE